MKMHFLLCLMMVSIVHANDLDDGISSDELMNDDLPQTMNVAHLKMRVMAASKKSQKTDKSDKNKNQQDVCGTGNIVIEAGAKVKEVINLSDNRGNRILCTQ